MNERTVSLLEPGQPVLARNHLWLGLGLTDPAYYQDLVQRDRQYEGFPSGSHTQSFAFCDLIALRHCVFKSVFEISADFGEQNHILLNSVE